MIAFDSSALVKLVVEEAETAALRVWLADRDTEIWSASAVCRVEVVRAVARVSRSAVPAARALMSGLDLMPVTMDLLELATEVSPAGLRSLDAIHLATVSTLRDELDAFVVYDDRLADAAAAAGLPVARPA